MLNPITLSDLITPANEKGVCFNHHAIRLQKGQKQIQQCDCYFKINNAVFPDLAIATVSREALTPLYNEAYNLRPAYNGSVRPDDKGYLTALRIFWGIDPDSGELCPIYQPVCLHFSEQYPEPDVEMHYTNVYSISTDRKSTRLNSSHVALSRM